MTATADYSDRKVPIIIIIIIIISLNWAWHAHIIYILGMWFNRPLFHAGRQPVVWPIGYTVVRLVTLDQHDTLSHCRQCGRHRPAWSKTQFRQLGCVTSLLRLLSSTIKFQWWWGCYLMFPFVSVYTRTTDCCTVNFFASICSFTLSIHLFGCLPWFLHIDVHVAV